MVVFKAKTGLELTLDYKYLGKQQLERKKFNKEKWIKKSDIETRIQSILYMCKDKEELRIALKETLKELKVL